MHPHRCRWPSAAFLVLLVIAPSLCICPVVRADEATDRAALERAAQAWAKAFNARDADAMVSFTTADVVLMDPTLPPVTGHEAARGAWQQSVAAAQARVVTATKEAVIQGDFAWRIGALTHELPNGDIAGRGQSLEIWKRMKREWKLHRQMSSGILAQPKLLRAPPNEPVLDTPPN